MISYLGSLVQFSPASGRAGRCRQMSLCVGSTHRVLARQPEVLAASPRVRRSKSLISWAALARLMDPVGLSQTRWVLWHQQATWHWNVNCWRVPEIMRYHPYECDKLASFKWQGTGYQHFWTDRWLLLWCRIGKICQYTLKNLSVALNIASYIFFSIGLSSAWSLWYNSLQVIKVHNHFWQM